MTNHDTVIYAALNGTLVHFTAYITRQELLNEEGEYYVTYSEGGSVFVCVKDGVLQQGETTRFDTYSGAVAHFASQFAGFNEVTEAVAEVMMMTAQFPPMPPMPEGLVPGTYAYTAWTMAQSGLMTGDEADAWKDEMKESSW